MHYRDDAQLRLYELELKRLVKSDEPVVKLSHDIKWQVFEEAFSDVYAKDFGRPGTSIRLLVGLLILKQLEDLSDDKACRRLRETPNWQYFCGCQYFSKEQLVDETTLCRFRSKIGETGARLIFEETIRLGKSKKILNASELKKVHVDTTVQEKNITYPTDAKLLQRVLKRLVKKAKKEKIPVKQSYKRLSSFRVIMCHRYAHAKQYRRAKKQAKLLCTYVGRVKRDIERKLLTVTPLWQELFTLIDKIIFQTRHFVPSGERIYSVHEPESECISKGKVNKKHEYGHKVSVVSTHNKNFIISCILIPGNPYDGHTLEAALLDVEKVTGVLPDIASVDLGYRGKHLHTIKKQLQVTVVHPRLKRGITDIAKSLVRKRAKVESVISLLKRCCRMSVCYLKGLAGSSINALLSASAYNLSTLLRKAYA